MKTFDFTYLTSLDEDDLYATDISVGFHCNGERPIAANGVRAFLALRNLGFRVTFGPNWISATVNSEKKYMLDSGYVKNFLNVIWNSVYCPEEGNVALRIGESRKKLSGGKITR